MNFSFLDRTSATPESIHTLIDGAPKGTWFAYYEGLSPYAHQPDWERHSTVGRLVLHAVASGRLTGTLVRLEGGTESARGAYRYLAKVIK